MTEYIDNDELLEELITEEIDKTRQLTNGSEDKAREVENLRKIFALSIEKYKAKNEAFFNEQFHNDEMKLKKKELDLRRAELLIKKAALELDEYKAKHVDPNEIFKMLSFGGMTFGGVMVEKSEGILLDKAFKNLPGKIKF